MKNNFGRTEENWYIEELKQGQKVEFDNGSIKGTGIICGISHENTVLLGKGYIILPDTTFENYDYSHIVIFEIHLNPIN
jgi:hypothetical protein